jgi:uncharacterized membrane protein (DUF441 family)
MLGGCMIELTGKTACLARSLTFLVSTVTLLAGKGVKLPWNEPCLARNAALIISSVALFAYVLVFLAGNAIQLTRNTPRLSRMAALLAWNAPFLVSLVPFLERNGAFPSRKMSHPRTAPPKNKTGCFSTCPRRSRWEPLPIRRVGTRRFLWEPVSRHPLAARSESLDEIKN